MGVFHRISRMAAGALLLAGASGCSCPHGEKSDLENLYQEIDTEISRSDIYQQEKEKRINLLKHNLSTLAEPTDRLPVYNQLVEEYEAFICDSALKYVEEARALAISADNKREATRLQVKMADIASHAGLFTEAHHMLQSIDRSQLDSTLLSKYYAAYAVLYQYESEYLTAGEYTDGSRRLRNVYADSVLSTTPRESITWISNWADRHMADNAAAVRDLLVKELSNYRPGNREYSIIASTLARACEELEQPVEQKRYLALSVVSDIRGAVKENMAIRELATLVFEDGDIDRANSYMKESLAEANFYAASMSNAQSSRMIPVIDKAYDQSQKKLQRRQRALIYITSMLLALAIIGLVVIIRQMRKVKEANMQVSRNLMEKSEMSGKLQEVNTALEKSNEELKTSNRTAQEYAGLFMEFCSLTISNLQTYHLALRNLALQGNVKGLLKKLDTSDATADTLKTFYQKFDEAILNIYPAFAERVNDLLAAEGKIQLREGERLNTELRILALIKIGISDSEKIAEFLRCSLSTIYTYRSKLKRRAADPAHFEDRIKEI